MAFIVAVIRGARLRGKHRICADHREVNTRGAGRLSRSVPECLAVPHSRPPGGGSSWSAYSPVQLAVLAKILHVRDVLGEVLLPVLLQVLLVALEQFGSTGFRGDPVRWQAGP